jgi:hypothetical protein
VEEWNRSPTMKELEKFFLAIGWWISNSYHTLTTLNFFFILIFLSSLHWYGSLFLSHPTPHLCSKQLLTRNHKITFSLIEWVPIYVVDTGGWSKHFFNPSFQQVISNNKSTIPIPFLRNQILKNCWRNINEKRWN